MEQSKQEKIKREKDEQEIADKIKPLIDEMVALEYNRSRGITIEKNDYVGGRLRDIEKEIGALKTKILTNGTKHSGN